QQHQELILTDLKHAFAANPLRPTYHAILPEPGSPPPLTWIEFPPGLAWLGHAGPGFAFDNEAPRHCVYLQGFRMASRLATNEEYQAFMDHGGYERAELWLSDGWAVRQAHQWDAPLYWEKEGGAWQVWTLAGLRPLDPAASVCHVSYYEADAFARW